MEDIQKVSEYFDHWNELKKELQLHKERPPFFREREVWWASIGQNIGDEQNGKNEYFERPVLITQRFYKNLFLGLPLSTKVKKGNYYYRINGEKVHGIIILSQAKVYDAKRLLRKIEVIDEVTFENIVKHYKKLI